MSASTLLFALGVLLALLGMHRYVWARLVRDAALPRAWHGALTAALAVFAVLVPVVFVLGTRLVRERIDLLAWPMWSWVGLLFYLVVLLLGLDVVRLAARIARAITRASREDPPAPIDPGRRVFLARSSAGIALAGASAITVRGVQKRGEITTPEIEVKLERLPAALDGFRIAHLTDVHLGPIVDGRFLDSVVEKTNASKPDLVVITGDMVDGTVAMLGREMASFARIRARHGTAFVTGNHEYYSGADEWIAYLRERGIRVLVNERVSIGDRDGASFDLAGIPDRGGRAHSVEHAPDLDRALAGRDPDRELVLLAHQPAQIAMAEGKGVGLQLSGHTHGGQMWPFGALVHLVQPYVAGFHRHHDGTQIYVSRGAGFWGPPLRVANPAEIATLVLRR